eukprot:gene33901-38314_t
MRGRAVSKLLKDLSPLTASPKTPLASLLTSNFSTKKDIAKKTNANVNKISDEDFNILRSLNVYLWPPKDGTQTSVKVTINGTNDAAVLSSAVESLDETNEALSTSGKLTLTDVDSGETFQVQTNVAGTHGKFSIDAQGNWSYIANTALNSLNVGDSVSD